ncbi:uncharacterized protein [Lolium perenne]|uniref:uncharacterized protein n=1 Tax=Lolium perenne TaxID=4522 RepID=UPI0021F63883|nr:uncharacterized protein LOC127292989 [Lolium perenne]
MAATMKLSLTFVLLLSGLVVFGDVGDAAPTCDIIRCIQGGNITCANRPGKVFEGCACVCAPEDGKGCVLHLDDGTSQKCTKTSG